MSWIDRARRTLRRPDEVRALVLPEVPPEVAVEVVPALLARAADSDSVVLAQGVPLDDVHVGFDPGDGDCPGSVVAVRVLGDGSMHVVRLETAEPAGWLTPEQVIEMRRRANETMPDYLELVTAGPTELDGQTTIMDALQEVMTDKRRQALDPSEPDYWAEVDAAGAVAARQQASAEARRTIMTMHYVPSGADPMVTACCGRYVEDVPAVEGVVHEPADCTCPRAAP